MNRHTAVLSHLLLNEWRSYVRNKRLRTTMLLSLLFMLMGMGLMFDLRSNPKFLNIVGSAILINSAAGMLGPFILNKDGVFFDGIMTRPVRVNQYILAKFIFLLTFSVLSFLVALPFIFFLDLPDIFRLLLVGILVYTLGVGIFLVIWFSSFDTNKIDYQQMELFNYDGIAILKQLITLPPFLPIVFFVQYRNLGIVLMLITGVLNLLFIKRWLQLISRNLSNRKYRVLEGFRH